MTHKETINVTFRFERPKEDIYVVNTEKPVGVKTKLEKQWRKYLNGYYKHGLGFVPICCETCGEVGEKQWHCHNSKSSHYGLNVSSSSVCSQWLPNSGMLMFLQGAGWDALRKRWDAEWQERKERLKVKV